MKVTLELHGVPLPVALTEEFMTPDFREFIEFYPKYKAAAGAVAWEFQPYLLWICKRLAKLEVRPGRTEEDWLGRIVQHFGLPQFAEWLEQYGSRSPSPAPPEKSRSLDVTTSGTRPTPRY
jgi:hypothetical protein